MPKDRDDHIEDVIGRLHLNSPEWFWFRYALLKKYFSSDPDFEDFEHFEHSNNEETSLDFIDEYPNDGFLKVAFGPFGVEVDDELFVYLNVRNLLILYGKLEGTINIFAGQNQITGNSSP